MGLKVAFYGNLNREFSKQVVESIQKQHEVILADVSEKFEVVVEKMRKADVVWIERINPLLNPILHTFHRKAIIINIYNMDLRLVNDSYLWESADIVLFESDYLKKYFEKKYPKIYDRILNKKVLRPVVKDYVTSMLNHSENCNNNQSVLIWYSNEPFSSSFAIFEQIVLKLKGKWKIYVPSENILSEAKFTVFKHLNKLLEKNGIKIYNLQNKNDFCKNNTLILCTDLSALNLAGLAKLIPSKGLIHYFPGADEMINENNLFKTIDEAMRKISNPQGITFITENLPSVNDIIGVVEEAFKEKERAFSTDEGLYDRMRKVTVNKPSDISTKATIYEKLIWTYRNENATYRFFPNIPHEVIEEFVNYGRKVLRQLDCKPPSKYSEMVLFVVPSIDTIQSPSRLTINIILTAQRLGIKNWGLLLLYNPYSVGYSQNTVETIRFLESMGTPIWYTKTQDFRERINILAKIICALKPKYLITWTFHYPLYAILAEIFREFSKFFGRFVMQDLEEYWDKKYVDFLIFPFELPFEYPVKNMFTSIWPVETWIIDNVKNIKYAFGIPKDYKVGMCMARPVKIMNDEFWDFIRNLLSEIPDTSLVFFGPSYDGYFKTVIPESLVKSKRVIFAGYNMSARNYLRTCDFYLNSYPGGGGVALREAYYAGLPIISFTTNRTSAESYMSIETLALQNINILYKNSKAIFPLQGDFEKLLEFAIKLLTDEKFRRYLNDLKHIRAEELKYDVFVKKMHKFFTDMG